VERSYTISPFSSQNWGLSPFTSTHLLTTLRSLISFIKGDSIAVLKED
jgi:hypothetical protein